MVDDNRFEGLEEWASDSPRMDETDDLTPETQTESPTEPTIEETNDRDNSYMSGQPVTQPEQTKPAVTADETDQRPFYAHEGAWDRFDDAIDFEIKRQLASKGHRDVLKREIHTEVLEFAEEHAEEIADRVARRREQG